MSSATWAATSSEGVASMLPSSCSAQPWPPVSLSPVRDLDGVLVGVLCASLVGVPRGLLEGVRLIESLFFNTSVKIFFRKLPPSRSPPLDLGVVRETALPDPPDPRETTDSLLEEETREGVEAKLLLSLAAGG